MSVKSFPLNLLHKRQWNESRKVFFCHQTNGSTKPSHNFLDILAKEESYIE